MSCWSVSYTKQRKGQLRFRDNKHIVLYIQLQHLNLASNRKTSFHSFILLDYLTTQTTLYALDDFYA